MIKLPEQITTDQEYEELDAQFNKLFSLKNFLLKKMNCLVN